MYPLIPLPLSKTRLVLSQHAFVDGNGCIMRCAMKRGAFASSRFWWESFRLSCKACSTAFAGMPVVDFLGTCESPPSSRDFQSDS